MPSPAAGNGTARTSSGYSAGTSAQATASPATWASTKAGTEPGSMPAGVPVNTRPSVTAGLANPVEELNQQAAPT